MKPIHIGLVNLMPSKVREKTQKQWSDSIHGVSEEIKISCIGLTSHRHYSRNGEATYREHVEQEGNFDGLIFTGAGVEFIPEDEIEFSNELRELIRNSQDEVLSCIYSCWSSHFASSELLGVHKRLDYKKKIFGVLSHEVTQPEHPLCNNLPPNFIAPHSRFGDISVSKMSIASQTEVLVKCKTNDSFYLQQVKTEKISLYNDTPNII